MPLYKYHDGITEDTMIVSRYRIYEEKPPSRRVEGTTESINKNNSGIEERKGTRVEQKQVDRTETIPLNIPHGVA
ncbi:unnamed protein product [Tuber melanosporum]|uniref:(Perigord truffle) hypothetical protein n=1 Tax=Tuber melanosporum (strain Mel28) TaxID=656061 RepID=D5G6B4_TUBMM|nr:uncharacterized protein GSTUM_00004406001 [Tuber melanosporum]CAZ80057.1 unnamed protein product [Tuber melanosporum]